MTTLWAVLGFAAGLIVGRMWGEAIQLFRGEDEPVSMFKRTYRLLKRTFGARTQIATWAIVVSTLISATAAGGYIIQARSDTKLKRCLVTYNIQSGQARDDRVVAQTAALQAQIDGVRQDLNYQGALLTQLHDPDATLGNFTAVINRKRDRDRGVLSTLLAQQTVSANHSYPPPDLCESP